VKYIILKENLVELNSEGLHEKHAVAAWEQSRNLFEDKRGTKNTSCSSIAVELLDAIEIFNSNLLVHCVYKF
jgi:hypothetical protein